MGPIHALSIVALKNLAHILYICTSAQQLVCLWFAKSLTDYELSRSFARQQAPAAATAATRRRCSSCTQSFRISNFARARVRLRSLLFLLKPTRYTFFVWATVAAAAALGVLYSLALFRFSLLVHSKIGIHLELLFFFSFHFISVVFILLSSNQNENWDRKKAEKKFHIYLSFGTLSNTSDFFLPFFCFISCSFIFRGFLSHYATIFCFENISLAHSCHCSNPNCTNTNCYIDSSIQDWIDWAYRNKTV